MALTLTTDHRYLLIVSLAMLFLSMYHSQVISWLLLSFSLLSLGAPTNDIVKRATQVSLISQSYSSNVLSGSIKVRKPPVAASKDANICERSKTSLTQRLFLFYGPPEALVHRRSSPPTAPVPILRAMNFGVSVEQLLELQDLISNTPSLGQHITILPSILITPFQPALPHPLRLLRLPYRQPSPRLHQFLLEPRYRS
jgi:hypothetical protein